MALRNTAQLWDEMAKIVLRNMTDFDSRNEDYPRVVAATVWQTVRRLREGRRSFRMQIRNELKEEKRRRKPSPPKP